MCDLSLLLLGLCDITCRWLPV